MIPAAGWRVIELDVSENETEANWREIPVIGWAMTDDGQFDLIVFDRSDSGTGVTFSEYKQRYDGNVEAGYLYKRWILSPKDTDLDASAKKHNEGILTKRLFRSALKTSA
jgi:hypothetical protein